MPAYNSHDPLYLNSLLTPEERQIQHDVQTYVAKEMMPHIVEWNRNQHVFPKQLLKGFAELGLMGATIQGYGCRGVSNVAYGLMNHEVEYCDSAFRSFISVQSGLVMHPIYKFGTEEQREKYLPKLASGEMIGCFGLTEPEAGSDPSGLQTTCHKINGGWQLNGQKKWITLSPIADIFIVWALDEDKNVRGFVLERGMQGLDTPLMDEKYVIRAIPAGYIDMDNVFVPDDNLLIDAQGLKAAFGCLNRARYGISWGSMGAAQFCFDKTLEYTTERKQFQKPLAANQLIQKKLVDMHTDLVLGHQLALRIGHLMDEGVIGDAELGNIISLAKRNNVGKALNIAREARDMHGGNGVDDSHHIIRHVNNLEAVNTYEGTHDIHALILGRVLTDIPAF